MFRLVNLRLQQRPAELYIERSVCMQAPSEHAQHAGMSAIPAQEKARPASAACCRY